MEESTILATLADTFMVEPRDLAIDTDFETLAGYDSVARLSLLVELCEWTGENVHPSVLRKLKTCRDVVDFVNQGHG